MRVGVLVPQGWLGEYHGWEASAAWDRTLAVTRQAELLGFESIWVFDHFETMPEPQDEITFESFTTLAALADATSRVRLGHLVACAGFRNAALTAKMISTMDVLSHGRMELGIGAGWKRDEWMAYGYGFPDTQERLAALEDHLEVITRMLGPGHATYAGKHASATDAINLPKGVQKPRVPVMVGGNGPNVTWRLAAKFADELNLDGLSPDEVKAAMVTIRSRCQEAGRSPESLPVSVHIWSRHSREGGADRVRLLKGYASAGVSRVMTMIAACVDSDRALEEFARDAREAGAELI